MPVTNSQSGTRIDEIESGIYRISTPVPANPALPAGFTFNQYLVVDDEPLLFHTGPRKMFALTREAMAHVMPVEKLRWVSFSHFEADECGALNEWLAAAPNASPLCGQVGALVSVGDVADRAPRALADGETIAIGKKQIRWFDAPHVPHGWDAGYIAEVTTRTLFCGDVFTQPGSDHEPLTEKDVLGPSEAMRKAMDYFAHSKNTRAVLERFAAFEPKTLACMHGAAFRGNGAKVLRELAAILTA
jgi:flavorubredoxin